MSELQILRAERREYKSKLMYWKGQQKKAQQQIENYLDLIDSINIKIEDNKRG